MKKIAAVLLGLVLCTSVFAQQVKGTLVTVSGTGEVRADNDLAHVTFTVEEVDKDKVAAASRVNLKMKQSTELLKKLDPDAKLATRGYYTYPVYSDTGTAAKRSREVISWRIGQTLELTTKNLLQLPANAAEVQQILSLNGINFGLADDTVKKLDTDRLNAAYRNLIERTQIIARAMGKNPDEAVIEGLDVDNSGGHFQPMAARAFAAPMLMQKGAAVQETSFEPGDSTLSATIVAKVRFN